MLRRSATLALLFCLAACGERSDAPQTQRVQLQEAGPEPADAEPSPDTAAATWHVSERGQAISFGNEGAPPLMTLACDLESSPPVLAVIRHARALPGQGALFPVMGNGMTSRFLVDATLGQTDNGAEWHWEARLPASDPQWDVFAGPNELEATLPGRGMLAIAGSRIPGEFVEWCRAGGQQAPVAGESNEAADEPEPAQ
ncbi:MAG: hypothetical protein KDE15_14450 [Erythrobacter sp.]|nr:hypothetical protein [Erythrobacter sp.]